MRPFKDRKTRMLAKLNLCRSRLCFTHIIQYPAAFRNHAKKKNECLEKQYFDFTISKKATRLNLFVFSIFLNVIYPNIWLVFHR